MIPVRPIVVSVVVLVCFVHPISGHPIQRRSLPELNNMIEKVTGQSGLDFMGYGNWCGFGGRGVPVDSIDSCCKTHDSCYGAISEGVCKSRFGEMFNTYTTYTTNYIWTIYQGHLMCNDKLPCNEALCKCDKVLAECFHLNGKAYNGSNQDMTWKGIDWLSSWF